MKADSVLSGKYRLISILGRGGMGSVWRAEHLGLRAPVAIKLLAPALDSRPDTIARFYREAQSAANLRSPHVVQILDHGVDEETQTPYIAMELMEGESLAERLARVSRLPVAETVKVITHAARALSRAHDLGIVHRDLKPGNLFLVQNEDDELTKVLDFGLAKWQLAPGSVEGAAPTATGQLLGTAYYMSPEQIGGGGTADHRADLWALGVIAYECLVGDRPFEGDNLVAIALKICNAKVPQLPASLGLPAQLGAWFERALAHDPGARFQSARELADELRRICSVADSGAPMDPPPQLSRVTAETSEGVPPGAALPPLNNTLPVRPRGAVPSGGKEAVPSVTASPSAMPSSSGGHNVQLPSESRMSVTAPVPRGGRRNTWTKAGGATLVLTLIIGLLVAFSRSSPDGVGDEKPSASSAATDLGSSPAPVAVPAAEPPAAIEPAPPSALPPPAVSARPTAEAKPRPVPAAPALSTGTRAPSSLTTQPKPKPKPSATAGPTSTSVFDGRY